MSQDNIVVELDESVEFGEYQMALPQQVVSECWGCREGILNQLGHMDYGGCLYFEEDQEPEEKESVIETKSKTETVESEEDEKEEQ